ncbi:hypothetical protein ACH0B6_13975 [Solibacillus silvestris]
MNPRPRGRYKKKKRDLILYLKVTLICYLAIFGVAYMSSDTSANFSSQSVITGTITADIWEIPEIPVIACGMEDSTAKVPAEESEPTSEGKATDASVDTVKDAIIGEEVEVDCGDLSDATEGEVGTDKSKEVDCKKTDAPESTEKVTINCKDEDEEKAAEDEEVTATEKDKEEKAAEDIKDPAVDKEKAEKEKTAEEVKTPATEKEKEDEKENAPENTETPATEKEKEAKPPNESITEEKAVNKEDGVKTGGDEIKENEGQKPNNESPNPPKSND